MDRIFAMTVRDTRRRPRQRGGKSTRGTLGVAGRPLLAVCAVTALLAGCGGDSSAASTPPSAARVWHVLIPATPPPNLDHPSGIAIDPRGNILVADTRRNRVIKLSPSGTVLARWGREGSGLGQFEQPSGVAVDSAGKIYVTDHWNNRVEVLSATGQGLGQWSIASPNDVAVAPNGDVYVTGGTLIERFSSGGTLLNKLNIYSADQDNSPGEIRIDGAGHVYVMVTTSQPSGSPGGNTVLVSEYSADLKKSFHTPNGDGNTQTSFVVDRANNLYYDYSDYAMEKYSPAGKLLLKGSTFGMDSWAAAPGGTLYGVSTAAAAVVKVSPALRQQARWVPGGASPIGALSNPSPVAVDRAGNVYVAGHDGSLIQKFSPQGRPLASWHAVLYRKASPSDQYMLLAADPLNNLDVLVGDPIDHNFMVEQFSASGKLLRTSANFSGVPGFTVDGKGNLLVKDPSGPSLRLSPTLVPLPPGPLEKLAGCALAVDRSGNVYLGNSCQANSVVRKISPSGKVLAHWNTYDMWDAAVDRAGNVYMTLGSGTSRGSELGAVDEFSPTGQLLHEWGGGVKPGQFWAPEGIAVTPQGRVVVADSTNDRIQELSAGG